MPWSQHWTGWARRPWIPRDIGGCVGWWDAAWSPNTQAGGLVSQWNDISGNANHLIAAGAARPTYTASGLVSSPELRFDGVGNVMTATFTLNQPTTLYIAFASVAYGTAGVNDILLDGNAAGKMVVGSLTNSSTAISAGGALQDATHAVPNGTMTRLIGVFNGASGELNFVDSGGVERDTLGSTLTNNAGGLILGCLGNLSRFYNAKVKEVALFNTVVSAANMARLKVYARNRYGLAA